MLLFTILVSITLLGVASKAAAQSEARSATGCRAQLASAERQYRNGAFERAIGSASACLHRATLAPSKAVQAYRILALAHIKQDELATARRAVVNLLGVDPGYTADRVNDPPVFVSMVALVKRELNLGRSAMPVRQPRLVPPHPSELVDTRARSASIPSPNQKESQSFFKRSNTWLTVGGIMVGGSAKSGDHAIGLGVGAIGVGAGGAFTGVGIGGLAVSGGETLEGIMVGGLGVGSGQRVDGIAIGGGGVGSGGVLRGLMIGGVGVGSGEAIGGITLGGLGVGTGGNLSGGAVALLGVGAGRNAAGFTVAGIGVGARRHMQGLHVAGGGVLASRLTGVAMGGVVLSGVARGVVAAPLYARIADEGGLSGLSVSLFNHVQGRQRGVTIGLLNVAHTLQGVQLGAINYAGNNPLLLRVLPLINLHF